MPNWQSLCRYQHETGLHQQACHSRDPTPAWTLPPNHLPLVIWEQPRAYGFPRTRDWKCNLGRMTANDSSADRGKKEDQETMVTALLISSLCPYSSWKDTNTPAFGYQRSLWCPKWKLVTLVLSPKRIRTICSIYVTECPLLCFI